MKHAWRVGLTAMILTAGVLTISATNPGVTLIGIGFVPGDDSDLSGLAGTSICQRDDTSVCIDQATLGGFGSGVAFTGFDQTFITTPDRGPFDGRTNVPYLDRFHFFRLFVLPKAPFPNIRTFLLDTRFLTDETGKSFVGDAYAFDNANPSGPRRFDPEGATVSGNGSFFVSDEYGPSIVEFDRFGKVIRRIAVPAKFLLDPVNGHPSGDLDAPGGNSLELYPAFNITGRQANRGMEGLTITPDGKTLVGIMQNALLQDHALNSSIGRVGVNNRILTVDLQTGQTHEYVYVMDAVNQGRGANDMLAVNDHEFLVVERDNRTLAPTPPNAPQTPNLKRIYKIDLAKPGLTDVSGIDSLPQGALPASIVPVTKTLFIDLLDPAYKVNATQTIKDVIAEKIEGLVWGPDLGDGRSLLYVFSDNDLTRTLPTQIYAFAVDGEAAGIQRVPQAVSQRMFLPSDRGLAR